MDVDDDGYLKGKKLRQAFQKAFLEFRFHSNFDGSHKASKRNIKGPACVCWCHMRFFFGCCFLNDFFFVIRMIDSSLLEASYPSLDAHQNYRSSREFFKEERNFFVCNSIRCVRKYQRLMRGRIIRRCSPWNVE